MIVLLGCSMNSYASEVNDSIQPSYGGAQRADSVLIAFDDLRIVNSKLIELEYEKEINKNLKEVIANDALLIDNYRKLQIKTSEEVSRAIRQRNIFIGTTVGVSVVTILVTTLLLVK